jgi:hypothetical protein
MSMAKLSLEAQLQLFDAIVDTSALYVTVFTTGSKTGEERNLMFVETDKTTKTKKLRAFLTPEEASNYAYHLSESSTGFGYTKISMADLRFRLSGAYGESKIPVKCYLTAFINGGIILDIDLLWTSIQN